MRGQVRLVTVRLGGFDKTRLRWARSGSIRRLRSHVMRQGVVGPGKAAGVLLGSVWQGGVRSGRVRLGEAG